MAALDVPVVPSTLSTQFLVVDERRLDVSLAKFLPPEFSKNHGMSLFVVTHFDSAAYARINCSFEEMYLFSVCHKNKTFLQGVSIARYADCRARYNVLTTVGLSIRLSVPPYVRPSRWHYVKTTQARITKSSPTVVLAIDSSSRN